MKHKIISLCLGLMLMCSASALAQNKTVTGTVLDELGEPVIGATVTVEGTKTATVTDLDGNYKISAPAGAKVTISYIGYMPQTVKPGGTVKLEEDKQTLEEIAEYAGLAPAYLSDLFHKETGLTLSSYLLRRRLEAAKNMLRYSDQKIAEIAEILAFSNASHFHRAFKKETGQTPRQYRRFADTGKTG